MSLKKNYIKKRKQSSLIRAVVRFVGMPKMFGHVIKKFKIGPAIIGSAFKGGTYIAL